MSRYALKIEYHGAPFVGWQRQIGLSTVQGVVEHALAKIAPGEHNIAAAGRTDKGVHALAQVAHCDMARDWNPFRLSEALNYHMKPHPVAILACARAPDIWHARFSATRRHYLYRILCRRAPAAIEAGLVWQVKHDLDVEAMRAGARHFIGHHDFTTFRATQCQSDSPVKTLDMLNIETVETPQGTEVHFEVVARSFLHNQVRSFVGTLEAVGSGSLTPDDVATALAARDRAACGTVSPAHGLYLAQVDYDADPFTAASPAT